MSGTGEAGIFGAAPVVTIAKAPPITEQRKYERMWERKEYRAVSPGESVAQVFLAQAKPKRGATVIDLGCGTGRGSLMLAVLGGMDVTMLDFAHNCLDDDIKPMLETQKHVMRFQTADLTKPLAVNAEYGFCTDVMEHIPTEDVDKVLNNALAACQHVFFQISTVDDVCGALIGHPLHLTVQPYEWWLQKFKDRGCLIHWSKELGNACMFYVTAWQDGQKLVDVGVLNIEEDIVAKNVKFNVTQGWKQVVPHETNDLEVMILGGGPSLWQYTDQIKQLRADGVKLITLNGAYNWALEQGLVPSAQIIVDAREFNKRFTKPVVDNCVYLIASQCDPSVLEGLPKDKTYLWHTTAAGVKSILDEAYDVWWQIPGGSTVLLRAIPLMRTLGYKKFHLFGCDSCTMKVYEAIKTSENTATMHHAYFQVENDRDITIPVTVGGRVFQCTTWQASQAQEFMALIKFLGNEIQLATYGDGLLNHILETGAAMSGDDIDLQ